MAPETPWAGSKRPDPAAHPRFGDRALDLAPLCSAGDRAPADFGPAPGPVPRWLSFVAQPEILELLARAGLEAVCFGSEPIPAPPQSHPDGAAALAPAPKLPATARTVGSGHPVWAGLWVAPETFGAHAERLDPAQRARLAPLNEALRAAAAPPPRARLMAVLNATPDSFSDGGLLFSAGRLDPGLARARALELVAAGADCLDVGGESTRPGAEPVDAATEWSRVGPLLEALGGHVGPAQISIDTQKAEVAERALDLGATWINDVSAGEHDPRLLSLAARRGCKLVLMHRQGEPRTMQADPRYAEPVFEIAAALRRRARAALDAGVSDADLVLDPGLGFGKRLEHNLALLARLAELRALGQPLLLGASRKSFLGRLSGCEQPRGRLPESLAAACVGAAAGAAWLRVHDVAETRAALSLIGALHPGEGQRAWN